MGNRCRSQTLSLIGCTVYIGYLSAGPLLTLPCASNRNGPILYVGVSSRPPVPQVALSTELYVLSDPLALTAVKNTFYLAAGCATGNPVAQVGDAMEHG